MSTWYSLSGNVVVRDCPEVAAIVERFNDHSGQIRANIEPGTEPETAIVEFEGGDSMSSGRMIELDEIAEELSPYAVFPSFLEYDCDGRNGKLFIGDPDKKVEMVEMVSADTLATITGMLGDLTASDRYLLVERIESIKD